MCGGGSDASSAIAKQAADDEAARQSRIKLGMQSLNDLFDKETTKGTGLYDATTPFDSTKTYYDAQGNPIAWKSADPTKPGTFSPPTGPPYSGTPPTSLGNPPMVGPNLPPWMLPTSELGSMLLNGGGVYTGKETTGFGPELYDKAYQAQKDYALPQEEDQFQDAQRQLAYGLARQGIAQSSSGINLNSGLAKQHALALNDVEEKANQARSGCSPACRTRRRTSCRCCRRRATTTRR